MEYSSETGNELLSKNIAKFKYTYSIYHDDMQVYYAEIKFKDTTFIIRNNKIVLSYTVKTEGTGDVENISKKDRHIITEYDIINRIINNTYDETTTNLSKIKEESIEVTESKLAGDRIKKNISIISSGDDGSRVIDSVTTSTKTHVTFISDNPIERISTNITNIYRDELLAGRMDFSQARINSIVSSLRFLQYRTTLENFIDLTWDMGIPHPPRD